MYIETIPDTAEQWAQLFKEQLTVRIELIADGSTLDDPDLPFELISQVLGLHLYNSNLDVEIVKAVMRTFHAIVTGTVPVYTKTLTGTNEFARNIQFNPLYKMIEYNNSIFDATFKDEFEPWGFGATFFNGNDLDSTTAEYIRNLDDIKITRAKQLPALIAGIMLFLNI